jgi:hypothetical protein
MFFLDRIAKLGLSLPSSSEHETEGTEKPLGIQYDSDGDLVLPRKESTISSSSSSKLETHILIGMRSRNVSTSTFEVSYKKNNPNFMNSLKNTRTRHHWA